jgi:predicted NAD/FAD-binding protein
MNSAHPARIAIVGSGIAGAGSAWLLSRQHHVTVYEAEARFGGHTDTHDLQLDGRHYAVDTGFIVFNDRHYPLLTRLFNELGVPSQSTVMSFGIRHEGSGLEYNATDLDRLFVQRRNLFKPRFLRMVYDITRFYREAPALLDGKGVGPTLGEYLEQHRYGAGFIEDHLVPMTSALWSSPSRQVLSFPARYLVQFMANHQMLSLGDRHPWRVVTGGSSRYHEKLRAATRADWRMATPVTSIRRDAEGVTVVTPAGEARHDHVVFACHSDQALAILGPAATPAEREVLGAIRYQANETVLHTDSSILPRDRRAWASWMGHVPATPGADCTVSYIMNLLQGIDSPTDFIVSLNMTQRIQPERILRRRQYQHPVYTPESVAAQARHGEISGRNHSSYAGAYWGWGFHEDGLRSAVRVAEGLGVRW